MALAAQVLTANHIPQSHTHIKTAICQKRDAAGGHRVSAALAPHAGIKPCVFIGFQAFCVNSSKHTAAFKISTQNRTDFLGCLRFAGKQWQGNGQLSQSNTGDFNPKLRPRR